MTFVVVLACRVLTRERRKKERTPRLVNAWLGGTSPRPNRPAGGDPVWTARAQRAETRGEAKSCKDLAIKLPEGLTACAPACTGTKQAASAFVEQPSRPSSMSPCTFYKRMRHRAVRCHNVPRWTGSRRRHVPLGWPLLTMAWKHRGWRSRAFTP